MASDGRQLSSPMRVRRWCALISTDARREPPRDCANRLPLHRSIGTRSQQLSAAIDGPSAIRHAGHLSTLMPPKTRNIVTSRSPSLVVNRYSSGTVFYAEARRSLGIKRKHLIIAVLSECGRYRRRATENLVIGPSYSINVVHLGHQMLNALIWRMS